MRLHFDIDDDDLAKFLRQILAFAAPPSPVVQIFSDRDEVRVSRAAAIVHRNRSTVFSAVNSGEIPSRISGKHRLVLIHQLKAWAAANPRKRRYHGSI